MRLAISTSCSREKELEVTHLLEIEADGIRRLADRISGRRGLGALVGPFLDLGLEFALHSIRRDLGEDLDVYVLEALECGTQVGRRANLLGQEIVDLVKSQVALLAPELDQTLQVFTFVLLLHAPKLPYQPASPSAGLRDVAVARHQDSR
jgi:hypothetical protein